MTNTHGSRAAPAQAQCPYCGTVMTSPLQCGTCRRLTDPAAVKHLTPVAERTADADEPVGAGSGMLG